MLNRLTIIAGRLIAVDTDNPETASVVVESDAQLLDILQNPDVFGSSTIDFAAEYTADPAVLARIERLHAGTLVR